MLFCCDQQDHGETDSSEKEADEQQWCNPREQEKQKQRTGFD